MEMKPHGNSLGHNPLSNVSYQNPGIVLNGQGSGRHPLGGALYLDLDTVLNKQGSGHRILSDALHCYPGVVKNEQGSSHLTRWMQMVWKLAEPSRLCVVNTMIMNILCVQEMKWKRQKLKEVEDTDFNLWYTCTTTTKNGVGIVIDKSLKDGVVDIKWQGDKIILVKLLIEDLVLNVISAYTPQRSLNESVKRSSGSWTR
jgi:hypothetical protein